MKVPALVILASFLAVPAFAQQSTMPEDSNRPRTQRNYDQQSQTPAPEWERKGSVETLRQKHMSSPNVQGEAVPENPSTGIPDPSARNNPKRLESVPRP